MVFDEKWEMVIPITLILAVFSCSCLSLTNWIWNCNSSLRTKFSLVIFAIVVAERFEYFEIWWKSHDQKSYYLYICNLMFVPISLTESLKKWMTIWNSYWWIQTCELETSQKHEDCYYYARSPAWMLEARGCMPR